MKSNKNKAHKSQYNMWQNTWYMLTLAWKEKEMRIPMLCIFSAVLTVLNNLVNLYVVPVILAKVENKVKISELAITILFFSVAMILCVGALGYVNKNLMHNKMSVRMEIRAEVIKKAGTTSYPNIISQEFTKLCAKAQQDTNSNNGAPEAIWDTLTLLLQNGIGFLIYVMLLSNVHPLLLILILITTLIGYFVSKYANGFEYRNRDEASEYINRWDYINFDVIKDYAAAKDIRIFGMGAWIEELKLKATDAYMCFKKRAQSYILISRVTDLILAFLRNSIVYAYLIHLVTANQMTVSEFLLYFSSVGGFTVWVSGIMENLTALHRQSLDISAIRECIEYPEVFVFEEGESLKADNTAAYEIRLDNVSFRYPGADKDTLKNINLTIHPGENIAVVGLNGAGKTTLVKLICGFLDPTEGKVLLNGKDIKNYNRRDYYEMFSAVFQKFTILAGTVAANVAQSETQVDMEKVKVSIEKAGLKEKVESLKKQYETLLNREIYEEAEMLSGGETQRLMLARALYKDAPFIILDEPTAALDAIAEADMYQKYHEMTAGKSSVYISHRLASTRFCDRILLIENAEIAEEGTHSELLERNGTYAQLFAVQSKYYQEGENVNEQE